MQEKIEYDTLEESLKRCGSNWDAAQTHGLLTGRLAIAGVPAGPVWMLQVLEGVEAGNALRTECQKHLDTLYQSTFWQLSERLSEFEPLLPDVIKDMLQMTRAGLDEESDEEENESAYVELVEYLRVAAQLCYEELADIRTPKSESK